MKNLPPDDEELVPNMVSDDAENHYVRNIAKMLYVHANSSIEQITAELELNNQIIARWRYEDNWDEERRVKNLTPQKLMERLYQQSDDIITGAELENRSLNPKECDVIVKLSKAITQLGNKLDPSTLMQAFIKLNNYIVAIDAELARKLIPYEKELIQSELKKEL